MVGSGASGRRTWLPRRVGRHRQRLDETIPSGVNGKDWEAIQQSSARILVVVDGTVTLQMKPDGPLGVKAVHVGFDGEEAGGLMRESVHSSRDRCRRVTMASM